jgi:phosphate transport system permease protein
MVPPVQQAAAFVASPVSRHRNPGDAIFAGLARASGVFVLLLLGSLILSLFIGGLQAFRRFGAGFLVSTTWDPVHEVFGAAVSVYGTVVTSVLALILAVPLAFGIAFFLTELAPAWMRRPVGIAVELLAAVPSIIYGMWGFFVIVPIMSDYVESTLIDTFDGIPVLEDLFAGPPFGTGIATAALVLTVMIVPFIAATMRDVFETVPAVFKESAYGVGCTTWEVMRSIVLPYTRASVVGGIMLGLGRALGETMAVTFVIGNSDHIRQHDRLDRGAGVSGKPGRQPETFVAAGTGIHPVRDFIHRAGDIPGVAASKGEGMSATTASASVIPGPAKNPAVARRLGRRRHLANLVVKTACIAATVIGLVLLGSILFTLIWRGAAGLSASVFTTVTKPPGSNGGLLNAIIGTLIQTVIGTLVGTPIGLMVGTYLAEYSHGSWLANAVRFVSDVLLSAPSILIGLFVYELVVEPFGGFSGIAGCIALAVIVIPIVVRTTEDMLRLIPPALREAAIGLGAPRWKVIVLICYRAAIDGIVTGVLLAVARIAGETAPLLFTSLGNLNWSISLAQPMASLPVTIYQYAGSAFDDWVQLAWVGALLITFGVLTLNVAARLLLRRSK